MASKYYEWRPPMGKVNNVTATLKSGGSLQPNTTYYVRVYATDEFGYRHGEISDEISFTTTSTELSVDLSWDAVSDSYDTVYYGVVFRRDSLSYDRHGAFLRCPSNNNLYYTTTTNSFTFSSESPYYYTIHAFVCDVDFPYGLDKNKGHGTLYIGGGDSSDPITPDDIATYLSGAGATNYYYDTKTFALLGNISVDPSVVTESAYFVNETHDMFIRGLITGKSGSHYFRFGKKNEGTDSWNLEKPIKLTFVPHTFIRPNYLASVFSIYFYGCILDMDNKWRKTAAISAYPLLNSGGLYFEQSIIETFGWSMTIRRSNVSATDTYFNQSVNFNLYTFDNDIDGFYDNTFTYADLFGSYDGLIIHRNTVTGYYTPGKQFRLGAYTQGDYGTGDDGKKRYYLRDVRFTTTDDDIPMPYYYAINQSKVDSGVLYPDIYLETEIKLKIKDKNGNNISGASIKITNDNGDEYTATTNADGEATLTPIWGASLFDPDGSSATNWNKQESYLPLTIEIKKAGYETYKTTFETSSDFTKDRFLSVTLKPDIKYSQDGDVILYVDDDISIVT